MSKTPIEAFGEWVATVPDEWPEEARHSAHRELIDLVAVMVPGAVHPSTNYAFDVVRHWGDGFSVAVGREQRLSAPGRRW